MKNSDINIRDPFVLAEDGKYYMYGTRAANQTDYERPKFTEVVDNGDSITIK